LPHKLRLPYGGHFAAIVELQTAVTPDNLIRMAPQNLLTGLPVKHLEAVG
jgi:hypothetical protein